MASPGNVTISLPFRLNMATMVNNSAISVTGPILGRNTPSYQSRPLAAASHLRVR